MDNKDDSFVIRQQMYPYAPWLQWRTHTTTTTTTTATATATNKQTDKCKTKTNKQSENANLEIPDATRKITNIKSKNVTSSNYRDI